MTAPDQRTSLSALVAANLVLVVGVLFFGWDARDTILIYWTENLVVGLFAVLRIIFARGNPFSKVFLVPFFCFHFGMFTFVHGMFVMLLVSGFSGEWRGIGFLPPLEMVLERAPLAVVALFLSHAYSFAANYIVRNERAKATANEEMRRPYSRVVVMHLTIMAAFFLMSGMGAEFKSDSAAVRIIPALVLVAIKTVADALAHFKEHASRLEEALPKRVDFAS